MSPRAVLIGLLLLAAAHYGWDAAAQPGFWGYDEGAHAGYALAVRETGRLPHPLDGWVTFHPPLYYLLAAGTWSVFDAAGSRAALFALRAISGLGILAAGTAVYLLARDASRSAPVALTAAALALFAPVAELSASMLGNEALGAGFAALALVPILRLQRNPGRVADGALAGLLAGLAAATKFSGGWLVLTAAVPFLRSRLDRRGLRSLCACAGLVLLVAGPVYARNLALLGTPFPFTRSEHAVMQRQEARLTVRPRRVGDYLVPASCGRYPYVTVVVEGGLWAGLNPAMQSVPCLAYAGFWFDPFGVRANRSDPEEGLRIGRLLLYAGLLPTLLMLIGLGRALQRAFVSRGRASETPLLVLTALGLGSFVWFTWSVPSLVAVKASYLLPLLGPAGVFFALGCALLGRRVRAVVLGLCLAVAALEAAVFTTGTAFAPTDRVASRGFWTAMGSQLPDSYIVEATRRLLD